MANSTVCLTRRASRPLPRPDFPLFHHRSGRWAKNIKGKFYYFGKVKDDPEGDKAIHLWLEQKDNILAGLGLVRTTDKLSVADLVEKFLAFKMNLLESGELAKRTYDWYDAAGVSMIQILGGKRAAAELRPGDFENLRAELAKKWGPVPLGNQIQIVRSIFRYGYESGLLDVPVRHGPGFKKPTAKVVRQVRASGGPKLFTPEQLQTILSKASVNMQAMILLAVNGGLGNTDVAKLPLAGLDLGAGWLDYPRPKTAMPRRIPLWPETVAAVQAVIAARVEPKHPQDAGLLFLGPRGGSYLHNYRADPVCHEFLDLLRAGEISGRTFYDLRRTFQTIAEGCGDLVAVKSIMGHAPSSGDMSSVYRQIMSDARLLHAANHVRQWLFTSPAAAPGSAGTPSSAS